jgi:hypothetical protein
MKFFRDASFSYSKITEPNQLNFVEISVDMDKFDNSMQAISKSVFKIFMIPK